MKTMKLTMKNGCYLTKFTKPMGYERNLWHYENEKLPALYEIFHKKHQHFTHRPAGNCLTFIIKVVATSRDGSVLWEDLTSVDFNHGWPLMCRSC